MSRAGHSWRAPGIRRNEPPPWPGWWRFGVMDRVELFLNVPVVLPKCQWFAENGNDFDAVCFGASRVYYGLSPKVFDATIATRDTRWSFNSGVGAMSP